MENVDDVQLADRSHALRDLSKGGLEEERVIVRPEALEANRNPIQFRVEAIAVRRRRDAGDASGLKSFYLGEEVVILQRLVAELAVDEEGCGDREAEVLELVLSIAVLDA